MLHVDTCINTTQLDMKYIPNATVDTRHRIVPSVKSIMRVAFVIGAIDT